MNAQLLKSLMFLLVSFSFTFISPVTSKAAPVFSINHNGIGSGDFGLPELNYVYNGSGLVNDVTLECAAFLTEAVLCVKTFNENNNHEMNINAEGFEDVFLLFEILINTSGTPWTHYTWQWNGFDGVDEFFFPYFASISCDAGTENDCTEGSPTENSVLVNFKEPFEPLAIPMGFTCPDDGADCLAIGFVFSGSGTLSQGPNTVPEPSTLAILGLGLAGLGFARRRKAA